MHPFSTSSLENHSDRKDSLELFRRAALLNPAAVRSESVTKSRIRVDQLFSQKFFNTHEIREGILHELHSLCASSKAFTLPLDMSTFDFLCFHWNNSKVRPYILPKGFSFKDCCYHTAHQCCS